MKKQLQKFKTADTQKGLRLKCAEVPVECEDHTGATPKNKYFSVIVSPVAA